MSEQKQPEWETVNKDSMTYRLKVPGGWLYKVQSYQGIGVAFVPYVAANEDRSVDAN